MGFRRAGKELHAKARDWDGWLQSVSSLVSSAGLPSSITKTEDTWWYFIERTYSQAGYLGEEVWFGVELLDIDQQAALWKLIELWLEGRWPDVPEYQRDQLRKTYKPDGDP